MATKIKNVISRVRRSIGFREDNNAEWIGPALAEIEVAEEQIVHHARALIREIQKRDGEGNTIPSHTYYMLAALVGEKV